MEHLEHDATRELHLLRDVHLGHSTTAEAVKDTVPVSGGAAKAGDLFGRLLERRTRELRKRIRTANADRR
jgi:hypothetical protein